MAPNPVPFPRAGDQENAHQRRAWNDIADNSVYAYLGEQLLSEFDGIDYIDSVFFEGQLLARVTDDGASVVWPEQTGSATPYEIHQ